ncbi:FMN-binding negative transcriptional regulator [Desertibaculum subflavum]|uniref:FMN-binding negative transcriptional regulator n=1 Tax=Desertibaculum subflavum TaxID=2268458 RepID=UPI000E66D771
MYVPRHFAMNDRAAMVALMRENPFAALIGADAEGVPLASHIPVSVNDDGTLLTAHVARANPHVQLIEAGRPALVVFSGPHAYVSPRWYASSPQVPTWNYLAVHAYGTPKPITDEARVRNLLAELAATHDGDYPDAWSFGALPEKYVAAMVRGLFAFEIPIDRLEGKAKLSQNKSAADIAGAVAGLRAEGSAEATAMAGLMETAKP